MVGSVYWRERCEKCVEEALETGFFPTKSKSEDSQLSNSFVQE